MLELKRMPYVWILMAGVLLPETFTFGEAAASKPRDMSFTVTPASTGPQ